MSTGQEMVEATTSFFALAFLLLLAWHSSHGGMREMEQTFHGSFWGNNTDLSEVMALATQGKIRHTITTFGFDQINPQLELLRAGKIIGRAVMKF